MRPRSLSTVGYKMFDHPKKAKKYYNLVVILKLSRLKGEIKRMHTNQVPNLSDDIHPRICNTDKPQEVEIFNSPC